MSGTTWQTPRVTAPGWPLPRAEARRLATLRSLGVLDQPQDAELDGLTRLASYICGTPTAVLNLIDSDRQWQASAYGAERGEVTRDESMCGYSILSRDVTYTPDASTDAVFAENPHVTGELANIRLYVAAPLIVGTDQVIGTLCAFAPEPSQLSRVQIERLRDLAATTVRMLELRQAAGELGGGRDARRVDRAAEPHPALRGAPEGVRTPGTVDQRPALLFIDLDGFKQVNDVHGHAAGDEVLRRSPSGCSTACEPRTWSPGSAVTSSSCSSRTGSTRAPTPTRSDGLDELAARIRAALSRPLTLSDGSIVPVGGSLGIARTTGDEDSPEDMLGRADAAMYLEKASPYRGVRERQPTA